MRRGTLITFLLFTLLLSGATAAKALDLTIYSDIDCFNWPGVTQRLCAQWRLAAKADGGFTWHCLVSGIAMNDELLTKKAEFSKADKKRLIAALKKGLKWSKSAHAKKVDIVKRIDTIGPNLEVDFLSTAEGRECVLRFRIVKLFSQGPVFMFTPYVRNKTTKHSIKNMIAALSASEKLYKQAAQKRKQQYDMFK